MTQTAADVGTALKSAARETRRRGWSRERVESRLIAILKWVGVIFFVAVTAFPFLYMLLLSVRPIADLARDPGALVVPLERLTFNTYGEVLRSVEDGGQGFVSFLRNSAIIATVAVIASLLLAIPGAYAISRLEFFGRRQVSFVFLAIYLFPAILLAIPLFVFFTRLGLRGSLLGLMIVYASQTVPVTIHMLRTYFNSIPESLEESATLEGCNRFQVMRYISIPLAMPAIMSTGLFVFMIAWNEFLFALLFLVDRRESWTVSLGLSQLAQSTIEVPTTVVMAGAVILTVPVIVLFFLTERLLVEGLTAGAEKG
ncbi:MAG TPA: carbohydrate ABC transporter permease [Candidatus Limnocylindria bacterium]|nr:carbohydrate ABC transporter permease [Candidatus Limnocylindria bacterium]